MAKNLFYKIGDACKALDIQPYVLRYWETEFSFLKPNKSRSGQRVYGEAEMATIKRIKELLYEEGYTIAGAKKKLEAERTQADRVEEPAGRTAETAPLPKAKASPPKAKASPPKVKASPPKAKASPRKGASGQNKEPQKLDSDVSKEIEKLRLGLEEALVQSRELLRFLGSATP